MTLTCPRVDAASSQLGGHRQQLSPLFCQQTGKTARDTKVVLFVVANQKAMHPQDFFKSHDIYPMTLRKWETLKTWKSIFRQTPQLWVVLRTFYSISYLNPPLLISENILDGKIRDNPTYGCNDEKAEHLVNSLLYNGRETSAKCFINIISTWQMSYIFSFHMTACVTIRVMNVTRPGSRACVT